MKKLLTVAFVSVLALSGCGKKAAETEQPTTTTEVITEMATEQTTEQTTEAQKEQSFDGLCDYLVSENVIQGERSEAMYSYISATNGCKYLDSDVELYEYDMTSDTYKSIVETKTVMGINVYAINGPYILIFSNDTANQAVIDAFMSY